MHPDKGLPEKVNDGNYGCYVTELLKQTYNEAMHAIDEEEKQTRNEIMHAFYEEEKQQGKTKEKPASFFTPKQNTSQFEQTPSFTPKHTGANIPTSKVSSDDEAPPKSVEEQDREIMETIQKSLVGIKKYLQSHDDNTTKKVRVLSVLPTWVTRLVESMENASTKSQEIHQLFKNQTAPNVKNIIETVIHLLPKDPKDDDDRDLLELLNNLHKGINYLLNLCEEIYPINPSCWVRYQCMVQENMGQPMLRYCDITVLNRFSYLCSVFYYIRTTSDCIATRDGVSSKLKCPV